ncbi:hypothetical protein ACFLZP_02465 [Patescibacteria group bacterium]
MDEQKLKEVKIAVREVERAIVKGKFKKISPNIANSRLTKQDIKKAIEEYGGRVTLVSDNAYDNLQPIEVRGSNPKVWAVDFDLWVEGKQSDLTLSLTVTNVKNKLIAVIDDLHIL